MAREPYLSALSEEELASYGSMEGLREPAVVAGPRPAAARPSPWPGYLLAGALAALAYGLHSLPFGPLRTTSAAILAILLGLAVRNLFRLPVPVVEAAKVLFKKSIPVTIVLTGAGLNLGALASVGLPAISVTVLSMGIAMAAAYFAGRAMGLWRRTSILIGAGTAICGNSAVVAVAPLIDAEDDDVVLSLTTVNLLGLVLMFIAPLVGGLLGLSDQVFGVWAGSTIHAIPQVVAAGFAFSPQAGALATLVKLVRVALLAPLVFVLAAIYARHHTTRLTVRYGRLIPTFLWGFLAMATLNTLGLLPSLEFRPSALLGWTGEPLRVPVSVALTQVGHWILALAMAAMGLEVNLRFLSQVGRLALLAGIAACVAMCGGSLLLIRILL